MDSFARCWLGTRNERDSRKELLNPDWFWPHPRSLTRSSTLQWRGPKRGYVEYDRSTVLQMIGRAGRPQFDKVARAVIMTQHSTRKRYEMELQKGSVVESNLKNRFVDFLNTEIALGTVNSKASAIAWIERTFFYIRAPRIRNRPFHHFMRYEIKRIISITKRHAERI